MTQHVHKSGHVTETTRTEHAPGVAPGIHGGGTAAAERGAHGPRHHRSPAAGGDGVQLSDEWDDEGPDTATHDPEGARPDDPQSVDDQRKQLEDQKKALEDEKKKLDDQIAETEKQLAAARRNGDETIVRELTQQLGELRQQRQSLQGQLDEVDTAIGGLPTSAGGDTSPAPAAGSSPAGGSQAPSSGPSGSSGGGPSYGPSAGGPAYGPMGGGPSYGPMGRGPSYGAPSSGGGSPAGGTNEAGNTVPAAPPAGPADQSVPGGPIGPGTKVLMIGDSHTIGAFGTELDKDLRSTGASVETYGSSGSSPSWWLNGTTTHSGYVARHADGSVEQPPWNSPHATPKLADLIAREHPDVVIVNLGANMRGESPAQMQKDVAQLAAVAKASGTRLVWVGPPKTRDDMSNASSIDAFNANMRAAVEPYGTYVDSSRYTKYSGSDGIHYGGTEGTQTARSWADSIFSDIQA